MSKAGGGASGVSGAVPNHFSDPVGLAGRVWSSGGRHGRYSLLYAGLSLLAMPLDVLMSSLERRIHPVNRKPDRPIVLVCGPARSGTTLMAELAAIATDAAYITNLMSMFPRSPISASRLFRVRPGRISVPISSLYGRTAGLAAPNDGLPLWDRWVGPDRVRPDPGLLIASSQEVAAFFGALQDWSERPVVTKNNALISIAQAVSAALPGVHLICMDREAPFLAQSMLIARRFIHGTDELPYGVSHPGPVLDDPIDDVIEQVRHHQRLAKGAAQDLGPDKFEVISYEKLCSDPRGVLGPIVQLLGADPGCLSLLPEELQVSRQRRLPADVFARFEAAFES